MSLKEKNPKTFFIIDLPDGFVFSIKWHGSVALPIVCLTAPRKVAIDFRGSSVNLPKKNLHYWA